MDNLANVAARDAAFPRDFGFDAPVLAEQLHPVAFPARDRDRVLLLGQRGHGTYCTPTKRTCQGVILTIPEAIRGLRDRHRWSRGQLVVASGYSLDAVIAWEKGKRTPSRRAFATLANLCDGELSDLFASMAGIQHLAPYYGETATALRGRFVEKLSKIEARDQLHWALDLILDRATEEIRKKVAADLTRLAGTFAGLEKEPPTPDVNMVPATMPTGGRRAVPQKK